MLQERKAVKSRLRGERTTRTSHNENPFTAPANQRARRVGRETRKSIKGRYDAHRETLLALRRRLRGSVHRIADAALTGYGVEGTSASPDAADRASETVEQDLALDLLGNTTGALNQIEEALARIDSGTYGQCMRCGAAVPSPRLEAIPYTAFCVDCASRRERRHVA